MDADYIIIGAGSAGCVLANRLSADPKTQVILLEAGGRDISPFIHAPAGFLKLIRNPKYNWCYSAEPDPGANGREIYWPRGKTLGGSSAINGLLYVRGHPSDFDRWRQMGNEGWGWDDVLPLFKRSEDYDRGASDLRGGGGELAVTDAKMRHPLSEKWIEAAQSAGFRRTPDYNGADQEGFAFFQTTIDDGKRASTANAFLKPVKSRPNLRVITHAHVQNLVLEGKLCSGVVYKTRAGKRVTLKAAREVILSAGTIGSPQILMLSGIGAQDHLRENDVEVRHDLSGVGQGMQDHLNSKLVFESTDPTYNRDGRSMIRQGLIAARYYLGGRGGPLSMPAADATGFVKTRPDLHAPDVQFHFQPFSYDLQGQIHPFSGFTITACQLRPESRGQIRLNGPDPDTAPKIHPNYLSSETDCRTMVEGVRLARRIAAQNPLAERIAAEYQPGEGVASQDYDAVLDWVRNHATTIYHPSGTCKMGPGPDAVVNAQLKVHGIQRLRVVDCSIMPELVSGNTNAATIMIAEKASQMILDDR
ncbi:MULTISPECIES: choline dehydrogenase [unclassified Ruegeria]|uniref:GMC family oxidoreductase n=1 Tax=unclassified Ruegeria TaxID=2625375 RepID=UPI001ADA386D|nr:MULTISPECIES: choline dehydrogenase [unclassified Ruegeria]MBO9413561.1 choline dehydrogenase [Ruegeria sp. R8_1]MBO9417256.1 choline dehydrogenase [Ruegeria sp. R8_2]